MDRRTQNFYDGGGKQGQNPETFKT